MNTSLIQTVFQMLLVFVFLNQLLFELNYNLFNILKIVSNYLQSFGYFEI
jgi:hypothetical protein